MADGAKGKSCLTLWQEKGLMDHADEFA